MEKLLIVAPHPDDEIINCATLIRRCLLQKLNVKVLIITDGAACYNHMCFSPLPREELISVRRFESIQAGKVVGLDENSYIFWDFPDGNLTNKRLCNRLSLDIKDFVNIERPIYIVGPNRKDVHLDHSIVSSVMDIAIGCLIYDIQVYMTYLIWDSDSSDTHSIEHMKIIRMNQEEILNKKRAISFFDSQFNNFNKKKEPVLSGNFIEENKGKKEEFFIEFSSKPVPRIFDIIDLNND